MQQGSHHHGEFSHEEKNELLIIQRHLTQIFDRRSGQRRHRTPIQVIVPPEVGSIPDIFDSDPIGEFVGIGQRSQRGRRFFQKGGGALKKSICQVIEIIGQWRPNPFPGSDVPKVHSDHQERSQHHKDA